MSLLTLIYQEGFQKNSYCKSIGTQSTNFLFDDPFIFLDNNGKEILINLLVSLKRSGKTIICLTEDKLLDKILDNEIILGN